MSTYLKLYLGKSPSFLAWKKSSPILKPLNPQDAQTNQTDRTFATHLEDPVIGREGYTPALRGPQPSASQPPTIWESKVFSSMSPQSPPLLLKLSGPGKALSRLCAYMLKGFKNELLAIVQQTVFHSTLILSELQQMLQRNPRISWTNDRLTSRVTKPVFPMETPPVIPLKSLVLSRISHFEGLTWQ